MALTRGSGGGGTGGGNYGVPSLLRKPAASMSNVLAPYTNKKAAPASSVPPLLAKRAAPIAPTQEQSYGYKRQAAAQTGGGGAGGGSGAMSTVTPGEAAPAPTEPTGSEEDYLAGDSTYLAAMAALKQALSGYQADNEKSRTTYETDYSDGLKNLGFQSGSNSWNQDDTNTAYGRSYQNQLNDFASRDMLQSSFYGDALNNMLRQFTDQKTDIDKGRTSYLDQLSSTLQQQTNENQLSQQQARAEAIARRAAGVMSY